ncbi:hypothetical protein ARHIZOSPH14_05040 [Agromyces rhizosphaerae]|uniref:Uncharacterized protein n=1 Tax=Agromyces rhizosphaerae TaxID=88374 RepID=A0A9W6CTV4_9MICO|nr:DUF6264 family protein [Agromyces rhizosphaerae]GLI26262.1 hypothetical protein ARHIZOSPH14_05040 [Agromyces rhizosphaerae]
MSDGTPTRRDDETGDDARTRPAADGDSGSSTPAERSTPESNAPADAAAAAAPDGRTKRVRPVRVWDLLLSIVLLLLLVGVAITGALVGSLFALNAPSCVNGSCDLFDVGLGIAIWGPIVVGVLGLAATVILLALRRRAFWVPLVGIALVAVVVFVGGAISFAAGSSF